MIGSVGTQSGLVGRAIAAGTKAVEAWAAAMNTRGGLNCHPIKYLVGDDGGDPNRHRSLVQKFVEEEKVIAFVYNDAPFSGYSSVDYINQKKVPVVGSEGGSPWFNESPYFFPQGTTGAKLIDVTAGAASVVAKPAGKTKVAFVACVEAPTCNEWDSRIDAAAKKYGMQVVYKARVSLTQPDYTSQCLGAQSAGAEVMVLGMDGNSNYRFGRSCAAVNFKPIYSNMSAANELGYANDPNLDGIVGGLMTIPWLVTSNPGVVEFRNALAKFAGGVQPDAATITGWVSAKVFELAGQRIPEPPTSAAVLQGLWSIKGNDLGGMAQPLTFTEGKPVGEPLVCFWAVQAKGGKWISPNNGQRTCDS